MSKLAQMLGVQTTTVWFWETNRSVPRRRMFPEIAIALNVSLEELGRAVAVAATNPRKPKRGAA
jgi:transcriptional regulator with XRE-family HTH domain